METPILSDKFITLAADTIVLIDGKILGKPQDYHNATQMLNALSGNQHEVKTSWALKNCMTNFIYHSIATTVVTFEKFSYDWISKYVSSKKPLDKSGAYGIQDIAQKYWKIQGEYENVVGFPIQQFLSFLQTQDLAQHFLKIQ